MVPRRLACHQGDRQVTHGTLAAHLGRVRMQSGRNG
jgi:hypothetical protein